MTLTIWHWELAEERDHLVEQTINPPAEAAASQGPKCKCARSRKSAYSTRVSQSARLPPFSSLSDELSLKWKQKRYSSHLLLQSAHLACAYDRCETIIGAIEFDFCSPSSQLLTFYPLPSLLAVVLPSTHINSCPLHMCISGGYFRPLYPLTLLKVSLICLFLARTNNW